MNLQQAVDICHTIREQFPHVCPSLTHTDRHFRDGSTCYIIGVYQGAPLYARRAWVLSSSWDWAEFLLLFDIFTNR